MRWIAGWHPVNSPVVVGPVPRDAHAIRGSEDKLWAVGYPLHAHRRVADPDGVELVVIGACLATDHESCAALPHIRDGHFSVAACLPGSYLAVMFRPHEVVIMGDLAGFHRVYFARVPNGLLWATAATPLAAYLGDRPDLYRLALALAVDQVDPFGQMTPFDAVEVVPPGSWLHLKDDRWSVEPWYQPHEDSSFDAAVDTLRTYLADSLSRHAQTGAVTSEYSGGIDSGALVALASQYGSVTGITYTDRWTINDDLDYARRIAAACPGIRHTIVSTEQADLPFSSLPPWSETPVLDLPCDYCLNRGTDRVVFTTAVQLGSQAHLSGQGGDCVLSADRSSLADLYRAGQRREAVRNSAAYARLRYGSPVQVAAAVRRLANSSYPNELSRLARQLTTPLGPVDMTPTGHISWCRRSSYSYWLTPAMCEWAAQELRRLAAAHDDTPGGLTTDWQQARNTARNLSASHDMAATLGLPVHTPYLDNTLVDACLSVPRWQRAPSTAFKPLMTIGLADLLPGVLTARQTKGGTEDRDVTGLRSSIPAVQAYIGSSMLVEAGVCDRTRLLAGFAAVFDGLAQMYPDIYALLAREHWLRQLDLDPDTWWRQHA